MDAGSGGLLSNGFLIFDYQSPTDFKFAGAYAGSDQWLIGHRDASGWVTDAVMSGVIDPLTDYQLRMVIESDGQVTLFENGLERVSHQFAGSLVDGAVGLATREAVTRFDNFSASEYVPPPPPPSADLPYQEDFDDGVADFLSVRSGTWNVTGGSYQVTPTVNEDGISTLQLSALPSELQLSAVVNMNDAGGGYFSNAFLIFDYQSPTDFKFAGAYAGSNQWLIGHRTAAGWTTDAVTVGTIDPLTDYTLSVSIQQDGAVMLFADGVERISHQFAGSLTDGDVGLGVRNAVSRFDNFTVEQFAPPPPPPGATLPHQEDFEDGVADYFEVHSGAWSVEDGELQVTPAAGADGISLLELDEPPTDLEISATINMDAASGGFFSNAFIIFDFKSATDFKFAGAYAGSDQWVIGHRTAGGWNTDAVATGPIDPLTDYDLRLVITSSGQATLHVDGVARVSRTYSEQLTDGGIGLGTRNAVSRFDNLLVTPVGGMQSEDPTDPGDGSRWCKAIDKLFALRERQERKGRSARPHDFEQAISVLAALQDKKLAKFTAKKANRHDLVLARYEKSSHELFDDVCTPAAKSLQALPKSHTKVEAAGRGRC
jgi:hypothetical protein